MQTTQSIRMLVAGNISTHQLVKETISLHIFLPIAKMSVALEFILLILNVINYEYFLLKKTLISQRVTGTL
jgi:hypothetical protein